MPNSNDSAAALSGLAGKRILVTGAAGFLGKHLCRALREHASVVFGIARQNSANSTLSNDGAQVLLGDCADFEFVRHALDAAKPDIVYHLAGSADGARQIDRLLPSLKDDLVSTIHLLLACQERGVDHLLVTGTMEEPDIFRGDLTPSSPYAAAKLCVNFYARLFQAAYAVPVTVLRPFFTYGPGQHESKLIPYVVRAFAEGKSPQLSSCRREVDLVFVDDMIDAFIRAAAGPPCVQGIDLGSGRLTPLRDVVLRIRSLMGVEVEPGFGRLADRAHEQVRTARVDRAAERLGWRVATSLDDGLRRTIAWHLDQLHSHSSKQLSFQ